MPSELTKGILRASSGFVKALDKAAAHTAAAEPPSSVSQRYRYRMPDITHPAIEAYAAEHSSPEPPLLVELAQATRQFSEAHGMMVGRLEGRFLKMLVAVAGARRVLELGTFTGYSALSMAEALPADGSIITCELEPRHAEMAREFIARSPYADRIEIRMGPALETVAQLDGPFDFAFIDAHKVEYLDYYEAVLPKLRAGGLMAIDNVLRDGAVLDESARDEGTRTVRALNSRVAKDSRVECVLVPIRDGVTLVRKL
jgi:caffeoyl-CoA O-methyltransferase